MGADFGHGYFCIFKVIDFIEMKFQNFLDFGQKICSVWYEENTKKRYLHDCWNEQFDQVGATLEQNKLVFVINAIKTWETKFQCYNVYLSRQKLKIKKFILTFIDKRNGFPWKNHFSLA